MDISRALLIDGWMDESDLRWLAQQASRHWAIVEIGCFLGRSTRALAEHTPGKVWAVDDFRGPRDVSPADLPELARDPANLLPTFLANMRGCEGHFEAVVSDHASADVPVAPDMVFIDGDHSYHNVARDIERWLKRLQPGGLLCGHDIDMQDVFMACQFYLPGFRAVGNGRLWTFTKPSERANGEPAAVRVSDQSGSVAG